MSSEISLNDLPFYEIFCLKKYFREPWLLPFSYKYIYLCITNLMVLLNEKIIRYRKPIYFIKLQLFFEKLQFTKTIYTYPQNNIK